MIYSLSGNPGYTSIVFRTNTFVVVLLNVLAFPSLIMVESRDRETISDFWVQKSAFILHVTTQLTHGNQRSLLLESKMALLPETSYYSL